MSSLLVRIADLLILLYQSLISPLFHTLAGPGFGCRFEPTCSSYCRLALRKHGVVRGFWLSLKRLSRCRPYGGSGEDPVPSQ